MNEAGVFLSSLNGIPAGEAFREQDYFANNLEQNNQIKWFLDLCAES
ncbi:MAG: hypothetical protein K6T80_02330 [Firmicutes bacterium]|nr:hypothetical protein [Bacillota bacterium]